MPPGSSISKSNFIVEQTFVTNITGSDVSTLSGGWDNRFLGNTNVSSSLSASNADIVFICDATSGNIVVSLPPVAVSANRRLFIKKIDSSANTVTIKGHATDTIDGSTTQIISDQYRSITLVCDGTNWWII